MKVFYDKDADLSLIKDRKVAILGRAYDLLVAEAGFAPENVVLDPNVLAVATGIEEHAAFAKAFIDAAFSGRADGRHPDFPWGYLFQRQSFRSFCAHWLWRAVFAANR